MLVLPLIVSLLTLHLALPLPIPEERDDGKYRPMPGEEGPLPGSDGDDGMYNHGSTCRTNTEQGHTVENVTEDRPEPSFVQEESVSYDKPITDDNGSEPSSEEKGSVSTDNPITEDNDVSEVTDEPTEPDVDNVTEDGSKPSSDDEDGQSADNQNGKKHGTSGKHSGIKVVCYFEDWAKSRPGKGSFGEDEMLNAPCTHVIYSFATLDASSNKIQYPFSPTAIQKLKEKGVKVMLAVGGARDSSGDKYSRMVASPESRKEFVDSVMDVMKQHDFDGFDVDWEYPTCTTGVDSCGGSPQDKENFVHLIRELRDALPGQLLTMASHPGQNVVDQAYDLPSLVENLDWINVMTYDLHGSWEKEALNHSPLKAEEGPSTDSAVQLYKSKGVPAEKIVIGVPTYGKSLRLADQTQHEYKSAVVGSGDAGPYTQEAGMLGYLEICESVKSSGWTVGGVTDQVGPYAYNGDQFVGFDDVQTAERKAKYAKEQGLGGVMVWALGSDDFSDVCGCGKYPIISALHNVLVEGTAVSECRL